MNTSLRNTVVSAALFSIILGFTTFSNAESNATPHLWLPDRVVSSGDTLQFVVNPTDTDAIVPGVFIKSAPDGARLEDNQDGSRTFYWKANQQGTHRVIFSVVDGQSPKMVQDVTMSISVGAAVDQSSSSAKQEDTSANKLSSEDKQFQIGRNSGDVEKILSNLPVSKSQINTQQTPLDVANGRVYIVDIEKGSSGDGRGKPQKTVLRQGVQKSDGGWRWESATIEDRTIYNPWHTAPSVGVDKDGFVHVVYNMHYTPWQYKRSTRPNRIDKFDFLGQAISEKDRKNIADNNIQFPTLGSADIPGNQITYPAFYKDRNRDLFLSYRFAATPKKRFTERTASAGIAAYDTKSKSWRAAGGNVSLTSADYQKDKGAATSATAFAGKRGWTAYHPRLMFDNNNQMLVHWYWRNGTGGAQLTRPCLLVSADRNQQLSTIDGKPVNLPAKPEDCGNLGFSDSKKFLTLGNTTIDANGTPHLLLSPEGDSRIIAHYDNAAKKWRHEDAPYGATEIFFDKFDTLWAISSGIRIFKRESGSKKWKKVYTDKGSTKNCHPSAVIDESGKNAFIHTQACDEKTVTVYALRLN